MNLPGNDGTVQSFTRAVGVEKSFLVHRLNEEYALWQIGLDRLEEFTRQVVRLYEHSVETPAKSQQNSPRFEKYYRENRAWSSRSLFMAVIGPRGISATGMGIKLWDGDSPLYIPEVEKAIDMQALIETYRPAEVWYGLRNSMEREKFQGDRRMAYKAYRIIIEYTIKNFYKTPNLILLSIVRKETLERYKRMGMDWRLAGDPLRHESGLKELFYPILLRSD